MTENEAIKDLQFLKERLYNGIYKDRLECIDKAIQALAAIQTYRAIWTVEGYERAIESSIENYNLYREYKAKFQEYEAIGTVEEFKALKEKSEPKKPLLRLCGDCQRDCIDCDRYEDRCPTCNGGLYIESGKPHEHCPHCGQKLDWQ